jgi:flagellar biosynthetic protein FliQ
MDSSFALYIARQALETGLLLASPILITCILAGVIMALFQAVTSIRDMSLTVVPKLLAVGVVCLICGGWMLEVILKFTINIFAHIQNFGQ